MNNFKDLEQAEASVPSNYYSERSDAPKFRPQKLIDDEQGQAKPYDVEFVEDSSNAPDPNETNALGMKANWYEEGLKAKEEGPAPAEEKVAAITLEELEAIRKAAYDDGFAEGKEHGYSEGHKEGYEAGVVSGTRDGFAAGQAEGLKNGQEIIASEAARFCRYANHLVDPIGKLDTEISSELIYLAGRLARAFIKQEVKVNPAYLEQAIADVCRLLPVASTNVSFRLNPADCHLVADTIGTAELKILPDPNLKPGDIAADAQMSSIDIRLEERIDKFLAEFMNLNSDKVELAPQNSGYEVNHAYDNVPLEPIASNGDVQKAETSNTMAPNDGLSQELEHDATNAPETPGEQAFQVEPDASATSLNELDDPKNAIIQEEAVVTQTNLPDAAMDNQVQVEPASGISTKRG